MSTEQEQVQEAPEAPSAETPAPVEAPEESEGQEVDPLFADILTDSDDGDDAESEARAEPEVAQERVAEPVAAPQQPSAQQPQVAPAPEQTAKPKPEEKPGADVQLNREQLVAALKQLGLEVPAATPQAQPAAPAGDKVGADQLAKHREQWLTQLETQYALSDEEAQAFVDEPAKVVPKQLARLHVSVAEQAAQSVLAQVPALARNLIHQVIEEKRAEKAFYKAWPQLRNNQYEGTITTLGQLYRLRNPQASMEQFVRDVGIQAVTSLGLPIQVAGSPPAEYQATAGPRATPRTQQQAFRPAAPGTNGGMPVPQEESNLFSELASDDVDWL